MKKYEMLIPLILMPLLLCISAGILKEQYYAACTFIFAVLACLFVMASFDSHATNIRRMVIIAVMTTISVMSRFLFAFVPGFKPMTAIIVLTAMYLGPESGFFCGAFTALISNMYFGQGPWTPFQMLSFGLLGLLAGVLRGQLKKHKLCMILYGIFAGVFYSFVMDIWTVLWYHSGFDLSLYLTALVTAIPYTVSYSVSNVVFLILLQHPFSKKMERIAYKVGM